jgi:multiple sugar transport system permease protein
MTTLTLPAEQAGRRNPMTRVRRDAWRLMGLGLTFGMINLLALIFFAPYIQMLTYSLKDEVQMADPDRPLLPMTAATYNYQGQNLPLYEVPLEDGSTRQLALLQARRRSSAWVDPQNPSAEPLELQIRAASLTQVRTFDPKFDTYRLAVERMNFPRILFNTAFLAVVSAIGAVGSAALVAYGFSRFRIPGGNVLFLLLLGTIILPSQVTLIPTYIVFRSIGWVGTFWPLIVPAFFSNAYNVFLLRQYFLTIPLEMDEAAKVDGATPFQTFLRVIVPQSRAVLITVFLFHFLFMWNDFFTPLIYLAGAPDNQTLSIALQRFQQLYSNQPNQQMAGAMLTALVPLIVFFLSQRNFMQGIVITGVDK